MVSTQMRLRGEEDSDADISFDPTELESKPLEGDLIELTENPSVDLALSIAEKSLGCESPKLREFARECKRVVEGESKADRGARLRYKRMKLFE